MLKFLKHNNSFINLNAIQKISMEVLLENQKNWYSVLITTLDGEKSSLGVFDNRDDAIKKLNSLLEKIEVIDLVDTPEPATKLDVRFN